MVKKYIVVLPLLLWLIFLFWIGTSEYFRIAIQPRPEIIDAYHFGAESMVTHGGNKYHSALTYSRSNLISAIISASGIAVILLMIPKAQDHTVIKAYFIGFLVTILQAFF